MTIRIRPADLEADRELIIGSLAKWLTPDSDGPRFDWLYLDNPAGEARVWIAVDESSQSTVGISTAFPRGLIWQGRPMTGWVLGDFCINPSYRSLGPALRLQRACLGVVESEQPVVCYDFPNQGMMAVYRRLRVEPQGQMIRLARPLRVDRKVRQVVNVPGVSRALSAAGNTFLGLRDAISAAASVVKTDLHHGDCTEEFSALAERAEGHFGLCVHRSAEYLNWRYLRSTFLRHELLTARRDRALVGYAVFTHSDNNATLVDLLSVEDPGVIGSLVNTLARTLRKRAVVTLSAPMWEGHRWMPLMKELGFWTRESSPVILRTSPSTPAELGEEGVDWFLWHGDRDS